MGLKTSSPILTVHDLGAFFLDGEKKHMDFLTQKPSVFSGFLVRDHICHRMTVRPSKLDNQETGFSREEITLW